MAGFYATNGNESNGTNKKKKKGFYAYDNASTRNELEYDGIKFGTVTDKGLKAIESGTLGSYTPTTEEERKTIEAYKSHIKEQVEARGKARRETYDYKNGVSIPYNPFEKKPTDALSTLSPNTETAVKTKGGDVTIGVPKATYAQVAEFSKKQADAKNSTAEESQPPKPKNTLLGNIGGVILSVPYAVEKAGAGAINAVEGVGDFLLASGARIIGSDMFGDVFFIPDSVSEKIRNYGSSVLESENLGEKWSKNIENRYAVHDWTRANVGTAFEGAGNLLPALATEIYTASASPMGDMWLAKYIFGKAPKLATTASKAGKVANTVTKVVSPSEIIFGLGAAGQSASEGYRTSGDLSKSLDYGAVSGTLEVAIERLFGGIAGTKFGKSILNYTTKSKPLSVVLGTGGEIFEELTSTFVDTPLRRLTVDEDAEWADFKDYYESGKQAIYLSLILGVGTYPFKNKQRKDAIQTLNVVTEELKKVAVDKSKIPSPLPENASIEDVQQRQKDLQEIARAYANQVVAETEAKENAMHNAPQSSTTANPQVKADTNSVVVGDTFKVNNDTESIIKVIARDDKSTTVEVTYKNGNTETMDFTNEYADKMATNPLYSEVDTSSQTTPVVQTTEAATPNAETTPAVTNNSVAVEAPTVSEIQKPVAETSLTKVGDTFTDTKNGDTIKVISRNETSTTVEFTDKDGNVATTELSNTVADSMNTSPRYVKAEAVTTQPTTANAEATPTAKGITSAYTNNNQKIDTRYKVVSLDDLIVSNNADGTINPKYPQELQPRERTRQASILQVQNIANNLVPEKLGESSNVSDGSPIVGSDNVVESGNGRTMALSLVYKNNPESAKKYIEFIKANAEKFGIDATNLPKNPVLVRERLTEVDRVEFVKQANESNLSAMSATELAKSDAERLTSDVLNLLVANDDGNINTAENRAFVGRVISEVFSQNDLNSVVGANGMLSANGLERIRNAIFYKAYGDVSLASKLAESLDNDIKNITNVLTNIAPKIVKVKNGIANGVLYDIDFSQDIVDGINYLQSAKSMGKTVVDFSNQTTVFDEASNIAKSIAYVFEQKNRGAKQATLFFNHLCDIIMSKNPNQLSFLGDTKTPTKEDVLNEAVNRYNNDVESERNTIVIPKRFISQRSEESAGNDVGRGIGDNVEGSTEQGINDNQSDGVAEQQGYVETPTTVRGNESTPRPSEIGTADGRPANRTDEAEVGAGRDGELSEAKATQNTQNTPKSNENVSGEQTPTQAKNVATEQNTSNTEGVAEAPKKPKTKKAEKTVKATDIFDVIAETKNHEGKHWSSDKIKKFYADNPDLDFIERIYQGDKNAVKELKEMISSIADVKTLEDLSWYVGETYRHKDLTFIGKNQIGTPYRGAITKFRNAIKARIKEIMTEQNNGTNLGITNGKTTLVEVRSLFTKLNSNDSLTELADKVFGLCEQLHLDISFVNQMIAKGQGLSVGDIIQYKTSYFNDTAETDQDKANTILHELIHSCTTYAISASHNANVQKKFSSNPEAYQRLIATAKQLESIYNEIKNDADFKGEYGITDVYEMVAELSNPAFVEKLQKKNLWDKIVDAICNLFGISRKTDAYSNVRACVDFLLENFDKGAYDHHAKEQRQTLRQNGKSDGHYSFSSIANSFFGDPNMTTKDFENGDYKQSEGYKNYVAKQTNVFLQTHDVSETEARKEIEDSIEGIVRVAIASKKAGYDIFDDNAKRSKKDSKNRLLFSSLEPNSDYFTSSDISTICDKRQNFADIYDAIVKREEELGIPNDKRFFNNVDNYFYIHGLMAEMGLTTPCRQCYVESMRKNLAPMAKNFLKLIGETDIDNKANDQLYHQSGKDKGNLKSNNAELRESVLEKLAEYGMSPGDLTIATLSTEDGLAKLKIQAPLIYEAFNSFYGQSKPKMPKSATPFRFGELTALLTDEKGKIKQSLVNKINSTGGFRLQSYSDFQIQNYVDVLQTIFEAGTLGLSGHAYTKVPAFLTATEGTNLKRNISIFMYKDGTEWKIDEGDSFPATLDELYDIVSDDESGNTGIIAVSQNEDMSAWIMANDNVGYGIPFHKSGMKMDTVRATDVKTEDGRTVKGYKDIKDHTRQQTEVWAKTTADHKANTKVKKGIDIYSFWDFDNKDNLSKNDLIKKNLTAYIDACEEAGYMPKFREYVMFNGKVLNSTLKYAKELGFVSQDATIDDISFKYKGFTIPYGYYKFLGDFGMFTPDRKASPVSPLSLENYDFDKAVEFFDNSEDLRRNEILQQYANDGERPKMRDSNLSTEELSNDVQERRNAVADEIINRNNKKLSISEDEGTNERNDLLSGDSRWSSNESTQKQAEGLPQDERRRTAEEIIAKGQTEEKVVDDVKLNLVKEEAYNDDMRSIVEKNNEKGLNTHFFLGNGRYRLDTKRRLRTDGIIVGRDVYLQYDGKFTPQTLNRHENVHDNWDTGETQKAKDTILNSLSEAEKKEILSRERYKQYAEFYEGDMDKVWEEFVADVLAGMSTYSSQFEEIANNYWSEIGANLDNFKVSEYTHSADAGGTRAMLNGSKVIPSGESLIDKILPKEYNTRGWSYGLFSVEDLSLLNERWKTALSRNYENKTSDGLSAIEVNNKVIFASGTYNNPVIEGVVVFNAGDVDTFEVWKGIILGDNYESIDTTTLEDWDANKKHLSEQELCAFYNCKDYQSDNKGIEKNGNRRAIQPRNFKNFGYDGSYEFRDGVFLQDEAEVSRGAGTSNRRGYSVAESHDGDYLSAVERGDMETAQRMVNKVAKESGYNTPKLYHGSGTFGFTTFRKGRIYATTSSGVAMGYNRGNGLGRIRNASKKYIQNDGTADTAIKNAKNLFGVTYTKFTDEAKNNILSKANDIFAEVSNKIGELDESINRPEYEAFWEYIYDKYGEYDALKYQNAVENLAYMLSGEMTAEEILENSEWFRSDMERYHERKQIFQEFYTEEYDRIKGTSYAPLYRYLNGFDFGDALIDLEFGINRLIDGREILITERGSVAYLDEVIEANEAAKDVGIYQLYGNVGDKPLVIDEGKVFWDAIPFEGKYRSTDYIAKWAEENGYTSVLFKTVLDPSTGGSVNEYADEYVFFDSEQVKSADPVVYDDNGNIIPLSQRFDSSDDDIRYSLSADDYVQTKSKAVMTDERIDYLIEDSGAGSRQDYANYWITSINPTDFINLTTTEKTQDRAFFDEWGSEWNPESNMSTYDYMGELKKNMRQTPYLAIDINTGEVVGHEGRHRMRALEQNGITSAEIRVEFRDEDGRIIKYSPDGKRLQIKDSVKLINQFGTKQTATIKNVIPLNKNYRNEILENYGDKTAQSADIHYSISADNESSVDIEAKWDEALKNYGAIKKGEKPSRDIDVPKKRSSNEPISWFARTALEAGITPNEVVDDFKREIMFGKMAHEVIPDSKSEEEAIKTIAYLGFEGAVDYWDNLVYGEKVGKKDFVLGMVLYNQAVTNKDYKLAMKLASDLTIVASESAQVLQSVRMLKKMSPDGTLYYLEKSVEKMNEEFKEQLGDNFKDIEIDPELMKELFEAETAEARDEAIDKIEQNIADQIPSTLLDKWNAWRYLAMLGNVRTHGRNVFGNMSGWCVRRVKNLVGAVIEKAIPAEQRTKSLTKSKESVAFAKDDAKVMKDILTGTGGKYEMANKIQSKRTIFKTKWLEFIRRKNFGFLEAEDWWFLSGAYQDSLAQLITARKIDVEFLKSGTVEANDLLNRVRAYAINEAKAATFRQASDLGIAINRAKRELSKSENVGKKAVGVLMEGVMPFTNVPINIAKQGVEYSPIGLVKGVWDTLRNVKKGKVTASEAIDTLSKGLTGTAIVALGVFLRAMGWLIAEPDDDDKKKAYDKMRGHQSYALEIGDNSYTVDWLTPSSLPLFVGVELCNLANDEGTSIGDIFNALSRIADPMVELSVLQGVSDALDTAKYTEENPFVTVPTGMITSYLGQALPTLGGQIARLVDNEQRTVYIEKGEGFLTGQLKRFVQTQAKKIPFASKLLEPQIDAWGEKKTYGSVGERIIESTISPGYFSKIITTEVDNELHRLFESTGENSVYPTSNMVKSFTYKKKEYKLTAEQAREFAEVRGKKSLEYIEKLLSRDRYETWGDEKKVKKIKEKYDEAYDEAKEYIIDKYFSE